MAKYQPPGRLSKVAGSDFVIQIQTEFAWIPGPRITTSVVLDGVHVHKIQKDWTGPLETDQERETVAQYINKQHEEVSKIVKSNKEFILSYSKTKEKEINFDNILELEGVQKAFLLTRDGLLTPFRNEEIEIGMVRMFEALFELVEFMDQMTKWGGMDEAYLVLDEDRMMIFRYRDSFLIITLTESASAQDTAHRVVDFIKAA